MKHTFESVLPLFVAVLGEPQRRFDADDVRDYGFHSASWCLAEHGNCHTITLTDEDGVLGVVATGARNATRGGGLCAGWVLNADDAAPNDNLDGDPVATPEEALRLAREWAKVPT